LATKTDNIDGRIFTTRYEYDNNDNLAAINYPSLSDSSPRRRVEYQFDSEHRITHISEPSANRVYASNFAYHPSGGLAAYIAGNGVQTTVTYDDHRYWPQSIAVRDWVLQYQNYDAVGNVGTIADSRGKNQTLTYDSLDRLTRAEGF
jgi:YD repeat-containing protein